MLYITIPNKNISRFGDLFYNTTMDIFIIDINNANKINEDTLKRFAHKTFTNRKKMIQHCYSYLMVDKILADYYKIENRNIVFENNKPRNSNKYFSISHSENYIVLAFSDFDCGIDAEKMKTRNYQDIVKRMGFKNCNTLLDFYNEWTKYEAEYKLAKKYKTIKQTVFGEFCISAVSENAQESFQIYIQNQNTFSNVNI